jgi:endoglucanase
MTHALAPSPRSLSRIRSTVGKVALAVVATVACAGTSSTSVPAPQSVADIAAYLPMPNDAPPGASASAIATAAAIGRGVNFGNMFEAPTEGAWGLTVTDDFIDKAAAAGFKSVRLPVRWSNHASADAPFTIEPAFLARVDGVVDKLLAKGLVVVLNMHHYRQLDGDALDAGERAVAPSVLDLRFVMLWEQLAAHFPPRADDKNELPNQISRGTS